MRCLGMMWKEELQVLMQVLEQKAMRLPPEALRHTAHTHLATIYI